MKWQLYLTIFITVQLKVTFGLYFPKSNYTFRIPSDVQQRTTIGRVYVLNDVTSLCDVSNITYMMYWPSEYKDKGSRLVDIDHVTGDVIVTASEDEESLGTDSLELSVNASCTDRIGQVDKVSVRIRIQKEMIQKQSLDSQPDDNSWFEKLCWRDEDQIYMIQENGAPLTFGDLRDPYNKVEDLSTVYVIDTGSHARLNLSINNSTSMMTLLTPLDREKAATVNVKITCNVVDLLGLRKATMGTTITLNVIDVNDNPPLFFRDYITPQLAEVNITKDLQALKTILRDTDLGREDQYEIKVSNDPNNLLDTPTLQVIQQNGRNTFILPRAKVRLPKDGGQHTVDIKIRDKGYQQQFNENPNRTDTATIRLVVKGKAPDVKTSIPRGAVKFSRLIKLSDIEGLRKYTHFHVPSSANTPFGVTLNTGIVYVVNESRLQAVSDNTLDLALDCRTGQEPAVKINVQVELTGSVEKEQKSCVGGCSKFSDAVRCISACGLSSRSRTCVWRPGVTNMSRFYETCTADIKTCPNGVCDELENHNPHICPQDCTRESPIGVGQLNSQTGRGISQAKGPCWCEGQDLQCRCMPLGVPAHPHSETSPQSTEGVTNMAGTAEEQRADDTGSCGRTCKMSVALTVVFVSAIGIAGVIVCLVWRRRRTRRSQILKHVGSNVSMTALPSDYLEDREPRASYYTNPSPQWSPKVNIPSVRTNLHVDKWEFPRDQLHLEQTLGEGEFGQVVQAKAFGINGDDKYATVAVKMLKPDASSSEYQDLWSELNLLKEVNHPNVIRLLGACTHNGPFYVIVEFCKYGSLKHFLRGARYKDRKSWDEKQAVELADSNQNESTTVLVLRDLLSFAWQIAKGMGYLSNMKFVHRDLAARNVLVSEGRVLKISDFGLSRDVYEADAYLKMTKGRIPVKWMAPESLYAQIYTTKSDIWSFGILLWEIITLGANPYPGIAPERLFSLLRTGYRMDRPEDCPEEVYAIMQKCWKSEPEERPGFSRLSDLLDTMLQQREGYLDLTDNTAYMGERLNYLDSTDLRGEWSDDDEGYGNITVLRQGGDNYLTAVPVCEAHVEEGDGEGERGKLLPSTLKLKESVKDLGKKVQKDECGEDVWLLKDRTISNLGKGKSWDNAYEIHCV